MLYFFFLTVQMLLSCACMLVYFCLQPQKVNSKQFSLDAAKTLSKPKWHPAQQAGWCTQASFFAAEYRPLQPVVNKIKKKGYFINYDCHSDAPFCHWPPPFVHGFAVNESSISDELMRVQPKTQNPWINEAMHVSHCAASPQTARQSMTLLLFLAKVEFVVYWIWHAPLWENFKGTS